MRLSRVKGVLVNATHIRMDDGTKYDDWIALNSPQGIKAMANPRVKALVEADLRHQALDYALDRISDKAGLVYGHDEQGKIHALKAIQQILNEYNEEK